MSNHFLQKLQQDSQGVATPEKAKGITPGVYDWLVATLVAAFLVTLLAVWFCFDHHVPTTDEAGHVLRSIDYANLYSHCRPISPSWWHKFLTVSPFYPPATYLLGGLLKAFVVHSRVADVLLQCIYCAVLSLSTYACARLVGLSIFGSAISSLLIGLYPGTIVLNHYYMLDLPLVSMVAFGSLLILWWSVSPTAKRSLLIGLGLGFACLTKQLVACYLAPEALVVFLFLLRRHGVKELIKPCAIVIVTAVAVVLPWLVTNIGVTTGLAQANREAMSQSQNIVQTSFIGNLYTYCQCVVRNSSLILFVLGSFFALATPKAWQVKLLPLSVSAVFGMLLLSTCNWCELQDRYVASVLIAIAIYTGLGLQLLVSRSLSAGILLTIIVVGGSLIQYLALNFSPVPIPDSASLKVLRQQQLPSWCRPFVSPPVIKNEWGTEEALDFIENFEKSEPSWFNVLSNQGELNAHTFELLVAEKHSLVKPTTSLHWTLTGDKVEFSPESALYYKWYLLRDGPHGFKFLDAESERNYNKLKDYVAHSGHFKLVWSHKTPDGLYIHLYRQN